MSALPEKKPDVYQDFKSGQFSIQPSCHNHFGRTPVDQATEVMSTKILRLQEAQLDQFEAWSCAAVLCDSRAPKCLPGVGKKHHTRKEVKVSASQSTGNTRIEEAVATVCQLVQGWTNPFAENQDLLNISTAKTAPRYIASDLMKAHDIGQ